MGLKLYREIQILYKLRIHQCVVGHLCLFVLKSPAGGEQFQTILNHMQHHAAPYTYRLNQRRATFYQNIAILDPILLYIYSWMRHDICYRHNDTTAGKRREKVDRQLVRGIIGLKHRMRLGIDCSSQLADELHKAVRRRFEKRTVFAKQDDDIWTADLVEMSSFSRSNKGYKYLHTVGSCL